ncbi:MAG: radical SAM protein [Candidatus Omnitrophica bacterium]|nr:radical SAM protein [Candidatus Omnitrophota bacterium]
MMKLGMNVDMDNSVPVVRSRKSIREPENYAVETFTAMLKATAVMYREKDMRLINMPSYQEYMSNPVWSDENIPEWIEEGAKNLKEENNFNSPKNREFCQRVLNEYKKNKRVWFYLTILIDPELRDKKNEIYNSAAPENVLKALKEEYEKEFGFKNTIKWSNDENDNIERIKKEAFRWYTCLAQVGCIDITNNAEFADMAESINMDKQLSEIVYQVSRGTLGRSISDEEFEEQLLNNNLVVYSIKTAYRTFLSVAGKYEFNKSRTRFVLKEKMVESMLKLLAKGDISELLGCFVDDYFGNNSMGKQEYLDVWLRNESALKQTIIDECSKTFLFENINESFAYIRNKLSEKRNIYIETSYENQLLENKTIETKSKTEILKGEELDDIVIEVLNLAKPEKADKYLRLLTTAEFILSSYEPYLNDQQGKTIRNKAAELFAESKKSDFSWKNSWDEFKRVISFLPTPNRPNTGLFIDVFEGMTHDDLLNLCGVGRRTKGRFFTDSTPMLELTKGCSNQCAICAVNAEKCPLVHMPFPVAVKILERLRSATNSICPYFQSEPLDYRDNVIGADISDVIKEAYKMEYEHISFVTDGSNIEQEKVPEKISKIGEIQKIAVSFHMYNTDVLDYVEKSLTAKDLSAAENEKLKNERARLIKKYAAKYIPIVKAAIEARKGFSIRKFKIDEEMKKVIKTNETWYKAMETVIEMQEEVWKIVNEAVGGVPVKEEEEYGKGVRDWGMLMYGRAASLLKNLGASDRIIEKIQNFSKQKQGIIHPAFSAYIKIDGSVDIVYPEDPARVLRPVGEMFSGGRTKEFRTFVSYIRDMLRPDEYIGEYSRVTDKELRDKTIETAGKNISQEDRNLLNSEYIDVKMSGQNNDFFKLMLGKELSPELLELLKDTDRELSDDELDTIFELLRDVPFVREESFHLSIKPGAPMELKDLIIYRSANNLKPLEEYRHVFGEEDKIKNVTQNLFASFNRIRLKNITAFLLERIPEKTESIEKTAAAWRARLTNSPPSLVKVDALSPKKQKVNENGDTVIIQTHDQMYSWIKGKQDEGVLENSGLIIVNIDSLAHTDGLSASVIERMKKELGDNWKEKLDAVNTAQKADEFRKEHGNYFHEGTFLAGLYLDGSASAFVHVVPSGVYGGSYEYIRKTMPENTEGNPVVEMCAIEDLQAALSELLKQNPDSQIVFTFDMDHLNRKAVGVEPDENLKIFRETVETIANYGKIKSPVAVVIAESPAFIDDEVRANMTEGKNYLGQVVSIAKGLTGIGIKEKLKNNLDAFDLSDTESLISGLRDILEEFKDGKEKADAIKTLAADIENREDIEKADKTLMLTALRVVLDIDVFVKQPQTSMDVVVQVVRDTETQSALFPYVKETPRVLREKGYGYKNQNIIMTEESTIEEMAAKAEGALAENEGSAILLLPVSKQKDFIGIDEFARLHPRVKIQWIDEDMNKYPDIMTKFALGLELIKLKGLQDAKPTDALNYILAVITDDPEALKMIMEKDGILKITKANFDELKECIDAIIMVNVSA